MASSSGAASEDRKIDNKLIKRLHSLNKRYRLGLAIKHFPTVAELPNYVGVEEADLWYIINERISELHRTPIGKDRIYASLGAYRSWAKKQQDKWVSKPGADPRVLGIPYSHIEHLKRVLEIAQYSSPTYKKRKSEEISVATTNPETMSGDKVQYPSFTREHQAELVRTQRNQDTDIADNGSRNDGSKSRSESSDRRSHYAEERPAAHDDLPAKRSRTIAPASRMDPESLSLSYHCSKFLQAEQESTMYKTAPSVHTSFETASVSRHTSFNDSFAAPIETPGTSFGSTLPPKPKEMGPPLSRPSNSIQIQKRNQRHPPITAPPSSVGSQGEFGTTSSLDEALFQGLQRSNGATVDSLHELHSASGTAGLKSTQTTLVSSAPIASGQTLIGTQPSSLDNPSPSHLAGSQSMSRQRSASSAATSKTSSRHRQPTSLPATAATSRTSSIISRAIQKPTKVGNDLFSNRRSPFRDVASIPKDTSDYRVQFERARIAQTANKKPSELCSVGATPEAVNSQLEWHNSFWTTQLAALGLPHSALEKSSFEVWKAATADTTTTIYSGKIKLERDARGLKAHFSLNPLKTDKSYRLARKFGADRFFFLDLPRVTEKDELDFKFAQWLACNEHHFLGRRWRCIFLRDSKNLKSDFAYQAVLFAVKGDDFIVEDSKRPNPPIEDLMPGMRYYVNDRHLVKWLLNLSMNRGQKALKLFSRIGLGLTKTTSSVVFETSQIVYSFDARSCCPGRRSLQNDHKQSSKDKHQCRFAHQQKCRVMNDGCGRISYEAAQQIRRMLDLPTLPSAFQGRIAGAKGVWIVDFTGEKHHGDEVWIEITESQLKFEALEGRRHGVEEFHRTFEVHSHSHALTSHDLSYTLLSILVDRGVPQDVFEGLLRADMARANDKFNIAMQHGGAMILEWIQSTMPVTSERASSGEIRWTGGFPDSLAERLIKLAETGHDPNKDRIMANLCYEALDYYYRQQDEKLAIGLPKSTNVLMIADPIGFLEEGEIFLQFSQPFEDEVSGETVEALTGRDVLVTRFPAYLPWDVQKVKAVFRSELSHYKDVIVFSTKGSRSLAEKLSGGDFDGDKAWVSWEETIVRQFSNAVFEEAESAGSYGIEIDSESAHDVEQFSKRALWQKGIIFNMRSGMLGKCANYYMAYVYHSASSLNDETAKSIGQLLGHLVDTAKNGYTFLDEQWLNFRSLKGLEGSLQKPAWKRDYATKEEANHSIAADYLRFWTAKDFRDRTLQQLKNIRDDIGLHDGSLTCIYKSELKKAKAIGCAEQFTQIDQFITRKLADLEARYQRAWGTRSEAMPSWIPLEQNPRDRREFNRIISELRAEFLALEPPDDCSYPLVTEWREEAQAMSVSTDEWQIKGGRMSASFGSWTKLKASLLVYKLQKRIKFQYTIAGKELCEIKASTVCHPTQIQTILGEVHAALRVDKNFVRRMVGRLPATVVPDEENDDIMSQANFGLMD